MLAGNQWGCWRSVWELNWWVLNTTRAKTVLMNKLFLYIMICFTSQSGNWQHASNYWSPPKLAHAYWCLWALISTACIPTPSVVRHGTCQHNYAVDRGPTLLSNSQVSISLITHGLCSTDSGQTKAHVVQICTNVVLPNHLPVIVVQRQTMNHIVDTWSITKSETTPRSIR